MKSLYISKKFSYDGTQLRSLYAYLEHRVLGPSIIAWEGPCSISFENMADGEDILAQSPIAGDMMLHFIIETFEQTLFTGVCLQRLFASIAKDYLLKHSTAKNLSLHRKGDDIYWQGKKLSISIAAKSPVSTMIHFAMNITNKGTPVSTCSLEDLELNAEQTAKDLMDLFMKEYEDIVIATQKVRPLP